MEGRKGDRKEGRKKGRSMHICSCVCDYKTLDCWPIGLVSGADTIVGTLLLVAPLVHLLILLCDPRLVSQFHI